MSSLDSLRETLSGRLRHPLVVTLALAGVGTVASAGLRASYFGGFVTPAAYGLWSLALLAGSVALGLLGAGMAGAWRRGLPWGVLMGVSPVLGLVVGAQLTVAAGFGEFDGSPLVLGGILVAPTAVFATLTWLLGRTTSL